MTSNLRIILTLFDVAALNCVRCSGLLIAVHFITANSNREIQFIARVESLISHLEVLSNFKLKRPISQMAFVLRMSKVISPSQWFLLSPPRSEERPLSNLGLL